MLPVPAGKMFIKNETWDITSLIPCPHCGEVNENYYNFSVNLEERIACEHCQERFLFKEGLQKLFTVSNDVLVLNFFSLATTWLKVELKIGDSIAYTREELGLDFIHDVAYLAPSSSTIMLYRILEDRIVIGLNKVNDSVNEGLISFNILVSGRLKETTLPLWKALLFQSYRMFRLTEYSMSIFLSYTAFEILTTQIINAKEELAGRLPNSLRRNKSIDIVSELTDHAITADNAYWQRFYKEVKKIRNIIAHESYEANREQTISAIISTILFLIEYIKRLPLILKKWNELPYQTNRPTELIPRKEYQPILEVFLEKWDPYNGDVLSHQRFVKSEEGLDYLQQRIKEGYYGQCDLCGTPLVPHGRRNKPKIDSTIYLSCLQCKKLRDRIENIDGAYFGTWLDEQTCSRLLECLENV